MDVSDRLLLLWCGDEVDLSVTLANDLEGYVLVATVDHGDQVTFDEDDGEEDQENNAGEPAFIHTQNGFLPLLRHVVTLSKPVFE